MLRLKVLFWLAFAVSIIFTTFIGYSALEHNPMGEFCFPTSDSSCDIVWVNFLPIVTIWFFISFVVVLVLLLMIRFLYIKIVNKRK